MDTVFVVLVILVVLGLIAGVGYLFVRETGSDHLRVWLSGASFVRRSLGSLGTGATAARTDRDETAPLAHGEGAGTTTALETRSVALALDDSALRDLREELQGDLRRASGVTREFDARLTKLEANIVDAPQVETQFERALSERDAAHRTDLERVQREIGALHRTSGAFGERRGVAIADLYGQIAAVEAALAGVVNPMLLPGEAITLPDDLHPDSLVWENWNDVGEKAFAFGNVFNQTRFVLDDATGTELERFVSTLRAALTGAVYPNVRARNPTAAQLATMRAGLQSIIEVLPVIRRRLEAEYRGDRIDR